MRTVWIALAACLALGGCTPRQTSAAPEGNWVSLFNGRDLSDWTPKFAGHPVGEDPRQTFRVKDGRLVVAYDRYERFDDQFGHLFHKAGPFSHYWIRAEYRFVGEQVPGAPGWGWRNNGLMLHSQPPETMDLDQKWPQSIEVRLLGGPRFRRRPTADFCGVDASVLLNGRRTGQECIDSTSKTYRGDQWVLVEAEVRGDRVVRHFVNGRQVMEYGDVRADAPMPWAPGGRLGSGYIAIQAESHPTEFRRIEILELES